MRNVSLKVLVKSLKFLFKKGYEPCHLELWLRPDKYINFIKPLIASATDRTKLLTPIVQKVDSATHHINLYRVDSVIVFPNTYPLDSDLSDG